LNRPSLPLSGDTTVQELFSLVERVHPDYRPVWEGRPAEEQAALAAYFLPRRSTKELVGPTRPRAIKWYCPFADQARFPSGHRYCLNVFTGCGHRCEYCYAAGYGGPEAAAKRDFRRMIDRDLDDLERFDVPPAPLHVSNSTDPFQPLELATRHARYALERVLEHRRRFTTVTLLTRSPMLPVRERYVDLLRALEAGGAARDLGQAAPGVAAAPGLRLHVSLAFAREPARRALEPDAPSLGERIEGLHALAEAGVALVLRIDPLFPRSPLPTRPPRTLSDFGLPELQTPEDLERLVELAGQLGARHVVYSAAKIVRPRTRPLGPAMTAMREVYRALAAPGRPVWRGGSWRLPQPLIDEHVVGPLLDICRRQGVEAKHCMADLLSTP
jgi:DNA repair photolyase